MLETIELQKHAILETIELQRHTILETIFWNLSYFLCTMDEIPSVVNYNLHLFCVIHQKAEMGFLIFIISQIVIACHK